MRDTRRCKVVPAASVESVSVAGEIVIELSGVEASAVVKAPEQAPVTAVKATEHSEMVSCTPFTGSVERVEAAAS